LGQNVADLSLNGLAQFLSEHGGKRFDQAFAQLERDVAGEAIADNDVDFTFENVPAFHVTDKVQRRQLEGLERLFGQLVSLCVLFADGQQTNARPANAEDGAGINITHDGELLEVVRLAVDVGANVEEY